MAAGRPKGVKNRRPRGDEYVKKAALLRASAQMKYSVPYDLDKNEKLDPMAILEEVMQHFYRKAKIEQSLQRYCDFRIVDNALQDAADCAQDGKLPAPAYQCHKAGCCRSECGPAPWGHDSGRDARDYPAEAGGGGVIAADPD